MSALRIAVCEDNDEDMEALVSLIQASLTAKSRPFDLRRFSSGGALQNSYRPGQYDVLFIDLFLGDRMGIDIARWIRAHADDCALIFVTQSRDFALDGYEVNAAHYLVKPVSRADVEEVWRRCCTPPGREENELTLMIDRKPRRISCRDIYFVEADNKRCLIHLATETLSTRMTIDQLEYMLSSPAFCRCHRGFLVNFDHVERIEKDFIMSGGERVYIRQSSFSAIRSRYESYTPSGA